MNEDNNFIEFNLNDEWIQTMKIENKNNNFNIIGYVYVHIKTSKPLCILRSTHCFASRSNHNTISNQNQDEYIILYTQMSNNVTSNMKIEIRSDLTTGNLIINNLSNMYNQAGSLDDSIRVYTWDKFNEFICLDISSRIINDSNSDSNNDSNAIAIDSDNSNAITSDSGSDSNAITSDSNNDNNAITSDSNAITSDSDNDSNDIDNMIKQEVDDRNIDATIDMLLISQPKPEDNINEKMLEEKADDQNITKCIICSNNPPNTIVKPCNHCVLCDECSIHLQNTNGKYKNKCIRCTRVIEETIYTK